MPNFCLQCQVEIVVGNKVYACNCEIVDLLCTNLLILLVNKISVEKIKARIVNKTTEKQKITSSLELNPTNQ